MKAKYWLVRRAVTVVAEGYDTQEAAMAEAERLATANPTSVFYVLEATHSVRTEKPPVVWRTADGEECEI